MQPVTDQIEIYPTAIAFSALACDINRDTLEDPSLYAPEPYFARTRRRPLSIAPDLSLMNRIPIGSINYR